MESFVKITLSQKFLSILPNLNQNQYFEQVHKILNEFGINPNHFPFSMEEFLRDELDDYISNGILNVSGVNRFLDSIETTLMCKSSILNYFTFVRNQAKNFDKNTFVRNVSLYAYELLNQIYYFKSEDIKFLLSKHWKLLYEDNFAILSAYQTLTKHAKVLEQFNIKHFSIYLKYLDNLLENYETLFDISIKPERKILIRSYFFNDLNKSDITQLEFIILLDDLKICQPSRIPQSDMELFWKVTHSRVIKEAVDFFIDDTLRRENSPFKSHDEGVQMVYDAFEWIYSSGNVFYFMINRAHGFSNEGYVFVHKLYQKTSLEGMSFRLLTLLHETFHIYKRFILNNVSPVNSFIIPNEQKPRAEDGSRFNNILIPINEEGMYSSSAAFICLESNWNTSLSVFQQRFLLEQNEGKSIGEEFFKFWSSASPLSMPYSCVRMQFRKNLNPDSFLYWR